MSVMWVLLVALLGLGARGVWISREVHRSDFFCVSSLESFDMYLADFCFQETATEWRKAFVSPASDMAYLQRFDNSSCTGFWSNNDTLPDSSQNQTASLVWGAAVGACTLVSADENWYASVVLHATKPLVKSASAYDYFANECGDAAGVNFRQIGAASCVQLATATGPVWVRTRCDIRKIVTQTCAVTACASCSSAQHVTNMFVCEPLRQSPAFNASGYWSQCEISSGGGGGGLTGVLPPPSGAEALRMSWLVLCGALALAALALMQQH